MPLGDRTDNVTPHALQSVHTAGWPSRFRQTRRHVAGVGNLAPSSIWRAIRCLLSGVKQTSDSKDARSHFDPKATLAGSSNGC